MGTGGLNAAFGTVSGAISSVGSGIWATPGLLAPEGISLTFAGLAATVVLANPCGVVSSGGVVVRAHGVQSNQETQTYNVNFAPLVPSSGSITAYLTAQIQQIQQNPVPLPGPPPGFPSFNPTYVPTVGYATNLYTLAVSGSTSVPDNLNTFELARMTLNTGQVTAPAPSVAGQVRAGLLMAKPLLQPTSGGVLIAPQLQQTISPTATGVTLTLPTAQACNGLTASFVNTLSGLYTLAISDSNTITGINGSPGTSLVVPASGAVSLYANGAAGVWDVISLNSSMNITWAGTNAFNKGVTALLDNTATFQFRAIQGTFGSGWRNDGSSTFLLSTNSGAASGTFNAFRPFAWNMSNGVVVIDSTAAGVTFGGNTQTNGISAFGTSGQFYANPNSAGNQILNFAANQFIGWLPGTGNFVWNTTGSMAVTAPGGLTIAGSQTTTGNMQINGSTQTNGNTQTNGINLFGTSGQFYANPNNAGSQLLNFSPNQYLQFVPSTGFILNTTGFITLNGPAGIVENGSVTINGTVSSSGDGVFAGVRIGLLGDGNYGIDTSRGAYWSYDTNGSTAAVGGWFSPVQCAANNFIAITGNTFVNMFAANFVVSSDIVNKSNIEHLSAEDGIAFVNSIKAKKFIRNGNAETGFVAQDIQNTPFDHMVRKMGKNEDPTSKQLGMSLADPIAYHHAAIKALLERIEALEKMVKDK